MESYRQQHKKRLSHMPWLYYSLKPKHREWATLWQQEVQQYLTEMETVAIGENCFIAPEANIFAEPGRQITMGNRCQIAAGAFLHGPITLQESVSINQNTILDGGSAGIHIGSNTRIAANTCLYAFNHGTSSAQLIHQQPVTSKGIHIGCDVWIGANVSIVDGVSIGDRAIIGMGSVVTHDIPAGIKAAGNPARPIGRR